MAHLQLKVFSHAYKVKALYKEALRQTQSYCDSRHMFRYQAVLLRERFDEHANEVDFVKAKKLLLDGQAELREKSHPQPFKFANSPGGINFGRADFIPDWVLDTWHPYERDQYPDYFARRHQRKLEYIERWEKKYGKIPEHEELMAGK